VKGSQLDSTRPLTVSPLWLCCAPDPLLVKNLTKLCCMFLLWVVVWFLLIYCKLDCMLVWFGAVSHEPCDPPTRLVWFKVEFVPDCLNCVLPLWWTCWMLTLDCIYVLLQFVSPLGTLVPVKLRSGREGFWPVTGMACLWWMLVRLLLNGLVVSSGLLTLVDCLFVWSIVWSPPGLVTNFISQNLLGNVLIYGLCYVA
jgi:hypothetical protein